MLEIYKYFYRYCFFFFFLGTGCDAILGTESRWAGCHRFSVGPDGHGKIPLFGAKIACLWHCSCHYQVRQSKCHDRLSWDHLSSFHSTEWCTPVRHTVGQIGQKCKETSNLMWMWYPCLFTHTLCCKCLHSFAFL